jgi:hypothetical protein
VLLAESAEWGNRERLKNPQANYMPAQVTKARGFEILVLRPVWKWIAAGITEGVDQVPDDASALVERLNHSVQGSVVIPIPFCGNRLGATPNIAWVCLFRFG